MKEHIFLRDWKKENIKLLKLVHPDWDEDVLCRNKKIR